MRETETAPYVEKKCKGRLEDDSKTSVCGSRKDLSPVFFKRKVNPIRKTFSSHREMKSDTWFRLEAHT